MAHCWCLKHSKNSIKADFRRVRCNSVNTPRCQKLWSFWASNFIKKDFNKTIALNLLSKYWIKSWCVLDLILINHNGWVAREIIERWACNFVVKNRKLINCNTFRSATISSWCLRSYHLMCHQSKWILAQEVSRLCPQHQQQCPHRNSLIESPHLFGKINPMTLQIRDLTRKHLYHDPNEIEPHDFLVIFFFQLRASSALETARK